MRSDGTCLRVASFLYLGRREPRPAGPAGEETAFMRGVGGKPRLIAAYTWETHNFEVCDAAEVEQEAGLECAQEAAGEL